MGKSSLRRKKLHGTNQGSDFLGDDFSNRDNLRALVQFRRESQPTILKDDFSSRTDPSNFRINTTSVIRLVKQNQH